MTEQEYADDFVNYVVERYDKDTNITDVDELTESIRGFISDEQLDFKYCNKEASGGNKEQIEVIKELNFYDWNEWTRCNYDLKNIGQVAFAAIDNALSDYGWNVLCRECAEKIVEMNVKQETTV